MKAWTKLLLSAMLVCGSAHAEKPTEASIKEMFVLSNTQEILKNVESQMDAVTKNITATTMKDLPVSPEKQKILDKFRDKVTLIHKQEMTWSKLEPLFIEVYQASLTQEDIDGINAFYRTPAGQSYIKKLPIIMQQTMGMMQKLLTPMMEKVSVAAKEMAEEINTLEKSNK